ncbi:MAG: NAD(P)/FAD-dependent oxidoreductase [Ktedonobacterales bacterium]
MRAVYRVQMTQELPHTADLVVIGGGIIGAATAYFAARAGLRAVVIEKRPLLATLTTAAATGAFRLQFDNPEEVELVREGIILYRNFAEIAEVPGYDIGVHQQGYLWATTSEATARLQRERVARQREWGLDDVELLSGDEARARFSYLAPEVVQARYRAGDGWLDPRRLTVGYAAASRSLYVTRTMVTGFLYSGERIGGVATTRGSISCSTVVVAAGPFSQSVARLAGLEIPLTLVRRQRMIMPEVPEVPPGAPMTIDEETGAHWRPTSTGANLLWTSPSVPPGPPLEDVPASDEFAFGLLDPESEHSVARITPFWRLVWERGTEQWWLRAGQYSYTPDHRPYLGPTPIDGLFVNCGYSGHGIMGSAGGSRIVVDTITGRLRPHQNPFRLDRPLVERALDVL